MKNQLFDPHYKKALEQKQKLLNALKHPVYQTPACVRKRFNLVPAVQIGIQHDGSQPIKIEPAIHTHKKEKLIFSKLLMRHGLFARIRQLGF